MFTFLLITYLVLSVVAAGVVISACIISGRVAQRYEDNIEQSASENYAPVLIRKSA
jgi:hypothetical protein